MALILRCVSYLNQFAERKLNDGSRYSIYKIFYHPAQLQARLESLGWRAAVSSTESFFLYGEAERG